MRGDLVTEGSPTELTARMEAEEGTTLEDVFLSVTAEPGPAASESAPRNTGDAAARQDGRVDDDEGGRGPMTRAKRLRLIARPNSAVAGGR